MKAGKNKISGLVSETETPSPPFENGVGFENDVVAEEELVVEDERPQLAVGFYEIEVVRMKRVRKVCSSLLLFHPKHFSSLLLLL